jgi:hypothetical protein
LFLFPLLFHSLFLRFLSSTSHTYLILFHFSLYLILSSSLSHRHPCPLWATHGGLITTAHGMGPAPNLSPSSFSLLSKTATCARGRLGEQAGEATTDASCRHQHKHLNLFSRRWHHGVCLGGWARRWPTRVCHRRASSDRGGAGSGVTSTPTSVRSNER